MQKEKSFTFRHIVQTSVNRHVVEAIAKSKSTRMSIFFFAELWWVNYLETFRGSEKGVN